MFAFPSEFDAKLISCNDTHGLIIKDRTWKRYIESNIIKQSPWLRVESLLRFGSLPSSLSRGPLRRQQSATRQEKNITTLPSVKLVFSEGRRMETIRETEDFKSSDKRRKTFYAHKSVLVRLNLRTLTSVNIYFIKMSHATKGDQAISDSETNSLNTVLKNVPVTFEVLF